MEYVHGPWTKSTVASSHGLRVSLNLGHPIPRSTTRIKNHEGVFYILISVTHYETNTRNIMKLKGYP
jgi:hypothetical protein